MQRVAGGRQNSTGEHGRPDAVSLARFVPSVPLLFPSLLLFNSKVSQKITKETKGILRMKSGSHGACCWRTTELDWPNTEGRMPFSLARFVPSVLPLRFLRLLLFNSESLTEDNEGNEGILE